MLVHCWIASGIDESCRAVSGGHRGVDVRFDVSLIRVDRTVLSEEMNALYYCEDLDGGADVQIGSHLQWFEWRYTCMTTFRQKWVLWRSVLDQEKSSLR